MTTDQAMDTYGLNSREALLLLAFEDRMDRRFDNDFKAIGDQFNSSNDRLSSVERKLDALIEHFGIAMPPEPSSAPFSGLRNFGSD